MTVDVQSRHGKPDCGVETVYIGVTLNNGYSQRFELVKRTEANLKQEIAKFLGAEEEDIVYRGILWT